MKKIIPTVLLLVSVNVSSALVLSDLGVQYNAMVFGNFTGVGGDTEGRHFTAGNMTVNDDSNVYSIGDAVVGYDLAYSPGRHDLVVGGNFTGNGGVLTESAYVGGSLVDGVGTTTLSVGNAGMYSAPGQPRPGATPFNYNSSGTGTLTTNAGAFDIDLATGNAVASGTGTSVSSILTSLRSESALLSQQTNSSTVSFSQDGNTVGITFTGSDSLFVYNASEADWDDLKYRTITAPAGATVLINVAGTDIDLTGTFAIAGGLITDKVLINYYEADTIVLTGIDHNGTLLAVETTAYSQSGAGVNGVAFIAGDAIKDGNGEFHNYGFTGDLSAVPEPSVYSLLFGVAVLGMVGVRRRR